MKNETLKQIGNRIRERRAELKISQAQLAEKISISPSHMSDIENGKKNLGILTFLHICETLQVSADWLIRADTAITSAIISNEISELLADCSTDESQLLYEILRFHRQILHTYQTK